MVTTTLDQVGEDALLDKIKNEIIVQLGGDTSNPFIWLYREPTEKILDLRPGSLAALHSGEKINLPFYKSGRRARYRLDDVATYLLSKRHITIPASEV